MFSQVCIIIIVDIHVCLAVRNCDQPNMQVPGSRSLDLRPHSFVDAFIHERPGLIYHMQVNVCSKGEMQLQITH